MTLQTVTLSQLEASAGNPRKAFDETSIIGLAQSIKTDGLLQNLVVAKPKGRAKKFAIISGERRFRAMQYLLSQGEISQDFTVPVEVKENLTEEEILRIATIENVQRENLSPLEEANAIKILVQDGEKLDEIVSKTGLSVTTIKRRLSLLNLVDVAKEALANKEIDLSLAEALSIGTSEKQTDLLGDILNGWIDTVSDLKEKLVGNLPTVADAIFPKEEYSGSYTTDLFSDDKTTFFNDVDEFMALQLAQAEKWAEDYRKTREWVEVIEGHFSSWEFDEAEEGQPCGTVICVSSWGAVEVHDNLLRKQKLDKETSTALRAKPVVTYPASLCRYISMHKSVAVQLALLNNPRKAKELAIIQKIQSFKAHSCHKYFSQNETGLPAFSAVTDKINALYDLFQSHGFDQVKPDVIEFFRRDYQTYDVVQKLSDEQLETALLTLSALEYGLTIIDGMDCTDFSLFNRLGLDMGLQMDECWCPDEDFLKRRNKVQLQKIITDAGFSGQFASVADYKKGELVKKLAKVFAKNFSENGKSAWLPEPMQFPAVNPDGMNLPEESEDLESDESDTEEYSEDDE